jgi:hypothetical protein
LQLVQTIGDYIEAVLDASETQRGHDLGCRSRPACMELAKDVAAAENDFLLGFSAKYRHSRPKLIGV